LTGSWRTKRLEDGTAENGKGESMKRENVVQAIGVLVFLATIALAIAATLYELNAT
jgi:hypothetical protein